MSQKNFRSIILVAFSCILLAIVLGMAGCGSPSGQKPSDEKASSSTTMAEGGEYVSDEQCLSCHGESYEALAERTADLGDWNPHNSIHGGFNACDNCHAKDKELTNNQCSTCHTYNPQEDAIFLK